MTAPSMWKPFPVKNRIVLAKPAGLWTLVSDFVEGSQWLKITASPDSAWSYADAAEAQCGPDGNSQALLYSAKCLSTDAPVGALIAKIGGSSVGAKDAPIIVVGNHCVFRVPDDGGPLYLTINDEQAGMGNNAGSIEVKVEFAPIAAAPEPAHAASSSSPLSALIAYVAKGLGWVPAAADVSTAATTGSNPADMP